MGSRQNGILQMTHPLGELAHGRRQRFELTADGGEFVARPVLGCRELIADEVAAGRP